MTMINNVEQVSNLPRKQPGPQPTQQLVHTCRLETSTTFGLLLLLFTFSATVSAQELYTTQVLYPQAGQRGTSVEVTVEGSFLESPVGVLFYQKGIRCTDMKLGGKVFNHRDGRISDAKPGQAVRLTFDIDDDAKPGEYQLRLHLKDNLGELLTFWVTPFPVVEERHKWTDENETRNDSPKFAQPIELNRTIYGYLPGKQAQDHDFYSVDCKRGQRLTIESVAARLGTLHYGGMNDPAITVYDSAGKQIVRNDDNGLHTQDAVVSTIIPADGTYFIDMYQQMDYEASRLRHYLLHVGTFPRPMVAFPLGAQRRTTAQFQLLGDSRGPQSISKRMPARVGTFEEANVFLRQSSPGEPDTVWPNRVHVAEFGDVFETAESTAKDRPQIISNALPLAINGRIQTEGETDWYRISAKKGQRFRIRTYAKSLDSELDANIKILPAPGNTSRRKWHEDDSLWDPHDLVGHSYRWQIKDRLDPIFMFEPDTDGDWLLNIADTRREFGPHHIYRIEIQPHVDSAFVHFPAYPSQQTIVRDRIVLFPGHSYTRPLMVQKGFGSKYSKPLRLRALNLPTGVTMKSPPFTQNDGVIQVSFSADKSAEVDATTVDVVVEPIEPEDRKNFRGGFVQVTQATNRRGDYAMYFNRSRKMALAVCEGAAFDLSISPPSIPLVRSGELELTVKVNRHANFDGAVYCEMDWLPKGINKQPPLIIPAGKTEATYKLSARNDAKPGTFPISITGRENEGGTVRTAAGLHYVSSQPVDLNVGEPYISVELLRAVVERGKQGQIQAEIKHIRPFTGAATLSLGRLPFGVKQVLPFPTITAGQTRAVFQVKATADCLVGQYKDIYCEAAVTEEKNIIRQQSGNGILRVDAERK